MHTPASFKAKLIELSQILDDVELELHRIPLKIDMMKGFCLWLEGASSDLRDMSLDIPYKEKKRPVAFSGTCYDVLMVDLAENTYQRIAVAQTEEEAIRWVESSKHLKDYPLVMTELTYGTMTPGVPFLYISDGWNDPQDLSPASVPEEADDEPSVD